eukprot:g43629.t1
MRNPRLLYLLLLYVAGGCPKPTLRHERVHQEPQLSDQVHADSENFQYDHEAFLGKEEAKTFEQLTPAESVENLRIMVFWRFPVMLSSFKLRAVMLCNHVQ